MSEQLLKQIRFDTYRFMRAVIYRKNSKKEQMYQLMAFMDEVFKVQRAVDLHLPREVIYAFEASVERPLPKASGFDDIREDSGSPCSCQIVGCKKLILEPDCVCCKK